MAKHRIFSAEYAFTCGICRQNHPVGTRAFFDENKAINAADCRWPDKTKGIKPFNAPSTSFHPSPLSPQAESRPRSMKPVNAFQEPSEDERVRIVMERLHKVIIEVAKEFGIKPEDVNPDSMVISECLRQVYGEKWYNKSGGM